MAILRLGQLWPPANVSVRREGPPSWLGVEDRVQRSLTPPVALVLMRERISTSEDDPDDLELSPTAASRTGSVLIPAQLFVLATLGHLPDIARQLKTTASWPVRQSEQSRAVASRLLPKICRVARHAPREHTGPTCGCFFSWCAHHLTSPARRQSPRIRVPTQTGAGTSRTLFCLSRRHVGQHLRIGHL